MFLPPSIPTASDRLPAGSAWLYQPKFDGWRPQVHRVGREARIFTRGGHGYTDRLPNLAAGLRSLPAGCVLDCELILPRGSGVDFYGLTRACWPGRDHGLALVAFDLLGVQGRDVRKKPLEDRLERLGALALGGAPVMACEAFEDGEGLLRACEAVGQEGVVAKRKAARYVAGRCSAWRKTKPTAGGRRMPSAGKLSSAPKGRMIDAGISREVAEAASCCATRGGSQALPFVGSRQQ